VGFTHAQRGNAVGAARLLRRGADRVAGYGADAPHGVDAPGVVAYARAAAERVESGEADRIDPAGLRLTRGSAV